MQKSLASIKPSTVIQKVGKLINIKKGEYSKVVSEGDILSEYQRFLIKKTWSNIVDDKDLFGQIIFMRIFENEPGLKTLFLWDHIATEELSRNPQFKKHTLMMIKVVEGAVKNIDLLQDRYKCDLHVLGRKHTRFRASGFTPYYWQVFKSSMLVSLTSEFEEDDNRDEIVKAWDCLITWMIDEMQEGYNETLKDAPGDLIP